MEINVGTLLTIVIPCRHENYSILTCLEYLYNQKNIDGATVIIIDSSKKVLAKHLIKRASAKYADKLNITIISNSSKSVARWMGSELCKTEYLLFLDEDTYLLDSYLLKRLMAVAKKYELTTVTFITRPNYQWMYNLLYILQKILKFIKSPYAPSAFQLWKTIDYWKAGGYNPQYQIAADFALTKNVKSKQVKIYRTDSVWVSPKLLEKNGHWYLINLIITAYFNRNNDKFFKKSKL